MAVPWRQQVQHTAICPCSKSMPSFPARRATCCLGPVAVPNSPNIAKQLWRRGDQRYSQALVRASSDEEPLPPWARKEELQKLAGSQNELPFWAWLLLSGIVTIAAVGSISEYANKNSIFGVVAPDSPFYAPILGFFALTGIPTAGYLFIKAVKAANKASSLQDKVDGY